MKRKILSLLLLTAVSLSVSLAQRAAGYGLVNGVMQRGSLNAITDVAGVRVGHTTLVKGDSVRTGVTAIIPHGGNIYRNKVPAAIFVGNGYGKLTGVTQVRELGYIETPIILTNTMSVPVAFDALLTYTILQPGNESVRSVNAVVGETNDGFLNDIRGRHVRESHVLEAIAGAGSGPVEEGCVGAGTGTVCFGFKGGIGTSSRVLPESLGGYTVGVLVQTNFGGNLQVDGVPVGKELGRYSYSRNLEGSPDGSCMIVVATDAPLDARNLERLAARAIMGLAKTGGIASNGSGDYVIAFSAEPGNFERTDDEGSTITITTLKNEAVTPLFMAVIEATEEAIINSLFAAETTTGVDGRRVDALPVDEVIEIIKSYRHGK